MLFGQIDFYSKKKHIIMIYLPQEENIYYNSISFSFVQTFQEVVTTYK